MWKYNVYVCVCVCVCVLLWVHVYSGTHVWLHVHMSASKCMCVDDTHGRCDTMCSSCLDLGTFWLNRFTVLSFTNEKTGWSWTSGCFPLILTVNPLVLFPLTFAVCTMFIYRKLPRTEEKCHWENFAEWLDDLADLIWTQGDVYRGRKWHITAL